MNESTHPLEQLDVRSYLRPIWRRKWIVLAIVVIAAGATYVLSSRQTKSYVSSARMYIQDADPTLDITNPGSFGAPTSQQVANVAQLVTAASIENAVARRLGPSVVSAGTVSAAPSGTSDFVVVSATSAQPRIAARIVNAYIQAFLRYRSAAVAAQATRALRAAQTTLRTLPKQGSGSLSNAGERQTLLTEIDTFRQVIINPQAGAQQINPAVVPTTPVSPKPKQDAIFGGAIGLLLGLLAAFAMELLDRRLMNVDAVATAFGRPILATLPHVSDSTPVGPGGIPIVPASFAEELRSLTVMLRLGTDHGAPKVILVCSGRPQEGKSSLVRNLALIYAESGYRVLAIDADLRRPSLARLFAVECLEGLSGVLRGELAWRDAIVPVTRGQVASMVRKGEEMVTDALGHADGNGRRELAHGSLDLLGHGEVQANPLPLLSSEQMSLLLEETAQAYDVVLLDSAPLLAVADAVPLVESVDAVVIVARLGETTRQSAQRVNQLLARMPLASVAGVVGNGRGAEDDQDYGGYGAYAPMPTTAGRERQRGTTTA